MDIIFQSGEFFNTSSNLMNLISSAISALFGAILSGLIAIRIFKRGITEHRNEKILKEKNRLEDIKEFYFHIINSKIEPINKQIKTHGKLINLIKRKRVENFVYNFDLNLQFDDLHGIDQKDIYKIFLHNTNSTFADEAEKFLKISNSIKLIESLENSTKDTMKYLNSKYQEHQDNFAVKVDKIQKLIQRHTQTNDVDGILLEDDLFLQSIWSQIAIWHQLADVDNRDPYILSEYYLQPIREICAKNHLDKRKPEILNLILDAHHFLEQLDTVKRMIREWIIRDTRSLIKAKISFESK